MAEANLLSALSRQGRRGSLNDLVLYGRVRCAIKKPKILGSSLEFAPGFFAILDCYAIKCKGEDYFAENGIWDKNKIYLTKGNLIIYLDNQNWIGQDVKVFGSSTRSGVKVRRQFGAKTNTDGVTAFVFRKVGNNFVVVPNKILKLGETDEDFDGTVLEDVVVGILRDNRGDGTSEIAYPESLNTIIPFEGTQDFEVLDESDLDDNYAFDDSPEKIDVTKIDLNLEYHLYSPAISELLPDFLEECNNQSHNRKDYAKYLSELLVNTYDAESEVEFDPKEYGYNCTADNLKMVSEIATEIRTIFIKNIAEYYADPIGNSKTKGKFFVDNFISAMYNPTFLISGEEDERLAIIKAINYLESIIAAEPEYLYGNTGEITDQIPVIKNDMLFAICVIGVTTGIGVDALVSNLNYCKRNYSMADWVWFYALIRYPYSLGMLGSGLGLVDCDVLYLSYYKAFGQGALSEENKDLRGDILFIETLQNANSKDTLVLQSDIRNKASYYPGRAGKYLSMNGIPTNAVYVEALERMCGKIRLSERGISQIKNFTWYTPEREDNLIKRGILNKVDNYVLLESDLEKEVFIYNTFIRMGHERTGITEEMVNNTIDKFEESRGFKLEKLQRDGCLLTMFRAGVLSGCAGSGKTTTSDCMTEILKSLPNYTIVYCTPTGKACRRLAEVVHSTVRTIHSQFSVGLGGESYLQRIGKKYSNALESKESKIYLLDEMAMAATPLVYEVARNIEEGDIIYFLGDIKQLPPIGKGCPFAILMKILPCVELGVSKRAAEGSQVNYNTTLINNVSDSKMKELYYDEKTFFCRECSDSNIPLMVRKVWSEFMSGKMNGTKYAEDNIQVITGYQKEEYLFSVPRLNPVIQQMLRAKDKVLFRHVNTLFYMNDRVIHLKKNCYDMDRYVEVGTGIYKSAGTFGIMNGEMGKLVSIVRSDQVRFEEFDESVWEEYDYLDKDTIKSLKEKREEREDSIRDDSRISDDKHYFVKVKVWDTDLQKDVYLMYTARGRMQDNELVLEGTDLGYLDLAYALSTHKMQGSQSQVVILPFGTQCSPTFINRNMINTMITRSQEVVCMVGSVKGPDSPVTEGRKYTSKTDCKDILTVLKNGRTE